MRNWLEINLNKLSRNVEIVRDVLPEGCDIIAIVKANAYGHGEGKIARALEAEGISRFAVASLGEGLNIREEGVLGDVLVLSYVDPRDAVEAARENITLAAVSLEHAKAIGEIAVSKGITVNVHIKLNTGMNRVGFECITDEDLAVLKSAYEIPGLNITGIFSHFSSSDDLSDGADEYTKLQLERYSRVMDYLEKEGINSGLRHISNSGAIGKYPQARFDAVRAGALLYGYNTAMDAKLPVEPIAEWKSVVSCVRTLKKGDAVSYSRHYIAKGGEQVATLCVGYADGYRRSLGGRDENGETIDKENFANGCVILNGHRCEIIGSICMDQMMVLADGFDVKMGDVATLMGPELTADELAEKAGTCMHDIISSIGPRVERIYIE